MTREAVSYAGLEPLDVPPYGQIWSSGSRQRDIARLASEVDEYFELGLSIPAGAVIVDVGANVGMFAIAAASRARDLHIVAIEPIPMFHAALERNFARNRHLTGSCVSSTLLRAGISRDDAERETVFTYFARLPTDTTRHIDTKRAEFERVFAHHGSTAERGVSALLPGETGLLLAKLARRVVTSIPRRSVSRWIMDRVIGAEEIRCPMTTLARVLDDLGDRTVDVLKIDVEGAEVDVLFGARDEQWDRIRQVVLEGTDLDGRLAEIRAFLTARGLTRQVVSEPATAASQGLESFLLLASRN
ncbi:MAG: FkbM family methyltransferase [Myxococcota bacterium]|nr:FkbM family methyltransferase [Myxococcota bacterium]